jgi:hypothetical protein
MTEELHFTTSTADSPTINKVTALQHLSSAKFPLTPSTLRLP